MSKPRLEKMKMESPDITLENVDKIAGLFPGVITEIEDENGNLIKGIDFDILKQELSGEYVEGREERYEFTWVGKKQSIVEANRPIHKTLRACINESKDWENTKNVYIEGDNLDALKLLQESYLNKVKMIYIDPPYNTGKDFIYRDNFVMDAAEYDEETYAVDEAGNRLIKNGKDRGRYHSDWCSMLYPRLKLAHNLLSEEGVIVVHIDEHEYASLEKILCEIFGEDNNLGTVVWDKRNPKGDSTGIAYQHEQILFYCKNREIFSSKCELKRPKENAKTMLEKANQLILDEGRVNDNVKEKYKEWLKQQQFSGGEKAYNLIDEKGKIYRPVSMAWPNKNKAPADYFIPLIHPVTKKKCPIPERGWRNPSRTMSELQSKGLILFGQDETTQPTRKYLLEENMYENVASLLYYGGSDDALISELGLVFDTPKVVSVSKKLINPICKENDIIIDFFAGSCTSAHAIMELNSEDGGNRQFIMVQLPEPCDVDSEAYKTGFKNISEIGKERIRRAGDLIKKGGGKGKEQVKLDNKLKKGLDIGFRVFKIDDTNMKEVYYSAAEYSQETIEGLIDNVKEDRTDLDLLYQVLINWGLPLDLPHEIEEIDGFHLHIVDNDALIACFDANIPEKVMKKIAGKKPLRAVFRDGSFKSSPGKLNIEGIFKTIAPDTKLRVI
jgi:adenine-specific DNA-methyltransferase